MVIEYKDTCTISRLNGEVDQWGDPAATIIYEGVCDFQQGGQTSLSIISHNDVVYLPTNDIIIQANDIISVITATGRKRDGVVSVAKDIRFRYFSENITEIEIKQGTGK